MMELSMANQHEDRNRPNPQQGGSGQRGSQQTQNPGERGPQHQQGERKESDRKPFDQQR
jgi:hypothetical protein